jgi:endonuclease/exonuclease/phosphatase family metal-dependent hydrolase
VRAATFNLMHGRSPQDGQVDVSRLREAVRGLAADVLGLQEVDRAQPRSGTADLTAIVAEAMGAVEFRFLPTLSGTPGVDGRLPEPGWDRGGPCYGIALATRWPVRAWYELPLPLSTVAAPIILPGRDGGLAWLPDEPRAVLAATVDSPAGPLTVATTHLSFVPLWNVRQLRAVLRLLRRLPAPRLLLGDLNLPAFAVAAVARTSGWRGLARAATYPSPRPRIQFDHILMDRRGCRLPDVVAVESPAVTLSDHRPLLVDLRAHGPGFRERFSRISSEE